MSVAIKPSKDNKARRQVDLNQIIKKDTQKEVWRFDQGCRHSLVVRRENRCQKRKLKVNIPNSLWDSAAFSNFEVPITRSGGVNIRGNR